MASSGLAGEGGKRACSSKDDGEVVEDKTPSYAIPVLENFRMAKNPRDCQIAHDIIDKPFSFEQWLDNMDVAAMEQLHGMTLENAKYIMTDSTLNKYAVLMPEIQELEETWKNGAPKLGLEFFQS